MMLDYLSPIENILTVTVSCPMNIKRTGELLKKPWILPKRGQVIFQESRMLFEM